VFSLASSTAPVEWDPYTFSILTEDPGTARFKDIIDGPHGPRGSRRSHGSLAVHHLRLAGREEAVGLGPHGAEFAPWGGGIEIKDKQGEVSRKYHIPSHAHLTVQDGATVEAATCR
jgi:hypothetical protein